MGIESAVAAAIGTAIFSGASSIGVLGASAGSTAILGTTAASLVGSIVVNTALIGASILLAPKPNANVPAPANGAIALRQPIPPRLTGYCRVGAARAMAISS
jgi:hypothetical protein